MLETHDVDVDPARVERDRLALGHQARRAAGQRPAQRKERLAETVPGLLGRGVTPEQRDQLFPEWDWPGRRLR